MKYAARHTELAYNLLGSTGLLVSQAGFGGYRVDISVQTHRQALSHAILSGMNLIDTSSNYADGGSERLVGSVLEALSNAGKVSRDEVVLVSKAGYLQGENFRLSQDRKKAGNPFQDLVIFDEELEHCIHQDFLADQLTRSLQRLGMDRIDCYLLHNPEYYLKLSKQQDVPVEVARAEYLRRIRGAFLYLEEEVKLGRIGCYGISSNTFPKSASDYEFTSFSTIWAMAEEISQQHHFRIIEFPCNLFETGAVTEKNQQDGSSLLEYAIEKNVATLINRPLNAIQGDQLIRLADNVYKSAAAKEVETYRKKTAAMDAAWESADSLSHLALRALRTTKGVTAILVGMRKRDYVEDVLRELHKHCQVEERKDAWEELAK